MNDRYKEGVKMVGQLLLDRPTVNYHARDVQGMGCHWNSRQASCFCFLGAIKRISRELKLGTVTLLENCQNVSGCMGWGTWDTTTDEKRALYAQRMADA